MPETDSIFLLVVGVDVVMDAKSPFRDAQAFRPKLRKGKRGADRIKRGEVSLPLTRRFGEGTGKECGTLRIVSINPVSKSIRILTFFPFQRHTRSISRT